MKIQIDKNNLLTIFNENIPQTKEYTYSVNGYLFSDFDTGIIILHKKEWKIINLKNLGNTMNVCYSTKRNEMKIPFDKDGFVHGLYLFDAFDENTGKSYYFVPKYTETEKKSFNEKCKKIGVTTEIEKTEKGYIVKGDIRTQKFGEKYIAFLFGLLFLYGKFESKKGELTSIKIQIPLFGQYMRHEEMLDKMVNTLQKEGIFLKADKMKNNNGIIYQISSNDYELLEIVAKWYEPVEKFEKITKRDFTQEMKTKLVEFIQTNPEIPQEGKAEVVKQIQEGTIKLLTK